MTAILAAWPALMQRETAAAYIDQPVRKIDELREKGEITPYGETKRVYFKREEIDAWIARLPERGNS